MLFVTGFYLNWSKWGTYTTLIIHTSTYLNNFENGCQWFGNINLLTSNSVSEDITEIYTLYMLYLYPYMASRPAVLHGLTFVEYLNDGLKFMTTINTAKRRPGTFTSRIVTTSLMTLVNISRPWQNGPHFVDAIVKCNLLNEKCKFRLKLFWWMFPRAQSTSMKH